MNRQKHEGFTLVELLIVMVVIGILSLAMMVSGEEISSSAKATQIINDLNAWKKAALAYWADNLEEVAKSDFDFSEHRDDVLRYLNVSKEHLDDLAGASKMAGSFETFQTTDGAWYIWYDMQWSAGVNYNGLRGGVCSKLAGRAKSAGLLSNQGYSKAELKQNRNSKEIDSKFYGNHEKAEDNHRTRRVVLMRVR